MGSLTALASTSLITMGNCIDGKSREVSSLEVSSNLNGTREKTAGSQTESNNE
jgi:hypothetical protein